MFLQLEDFSLQSLMVVNCGPFVSTFLTLLIIFILVLGLLSRIAIINYIKKMAMNRPISLNILLDQMIELPNFIIASLMLATSLATGKSIQTIFGSPGILIFWISSLIHNISMNIGGFGVAIFRLISILDLGLALNIQKAKKLMNQIIKAEIIIQLILDSLCIAGGLFLPNDSMLINTAKGHSAIMENILNPMENDWHQMIGKIGISLSFLIAIICTLVELTCYLIIHVQVYRNDEKIKESISKKSACFRQKRNIISLSTQMIGSLVVIFGGIAGTLIVGLNIADASIFPIFTLATSALISALHVLASTEMRQYYGL